MIIHQDTFIEFLRKKYKSLIISDLHFSQIVNPKSHGRPRRNFLNDRRF